MWRSCATNIGRQCFGNKTYKTNISTHIHTLNAKHNFPNNKCNKCSFDKEVPKSGTNKLFEMNTFAYSVFRIRANEAQFLLYEEVQCTICKKYFFSSSQYFWQLPQMQTQSYEQHVLQLTTMKSVAQSSCNCWTSNLDSTKKKITFGILACSMFDILCGSWPEKQTNEDSEFNANTRKLLPFKMWWIESQTKATISSIQYIRALTKWLNVKLVIFTRLIDGNLLPTWSCT